MKLRSFINHVLLKNKPYQVSKVHAYEKNNPDSKFTDFFELAVAHQLARRPDFFFIQVGANDGILADELRPLIMKYKLSGVCIEPQKDEFEILTKTYENIPGITLLRAALHPTEDKFTIYKANKSVKNLPAHAKGIASFDKQHLISILSKLDGYNEDYIVEELVPCVQFDRIFEMTNKDHLELLQIDTEGFDYEIIKMLDLNKIKPAIIRFEIYNLSDKDKNECLAYLEKNNYKMIYDRIDVIAIDQSTLDQSAID